MSSPDEFLMVGVGELGRNPSDIVDRVRHGERLIVCRYHVPVATIQPLNGVIRQPFDPVAYGVDGLAVGDLHQMARDLRPFEKELFLTCNPYMNVDKFRTGLVPEKWRDEWSSETFESLRIRGLAKNGNRGWVATGLGLALLDELRAMVDCGDLNTEVPRTKPPKPPWG